MMSRRSPTRRFNIIRLVSSTQWPLQLALSVRVQTAAVLCGQSVASLLLFRDYYVVARYGADGPPGRIVVRRSHYNLCKGGFTTARQRKALTKKLGCLSNLPGMLQKQVAASYRKHGPSVIWRTHTAA